MAATPARIAFVLTAFRRAVATTAAVKTNYGGMARETDDPVPTFFDNVTDAQTVADARQALLSADRRRFRATVNSATEALGLAYAGAIPTAQYTDPERGIDRKMLVSEITIDLGRQSAGFTLWG